MRIAHIASEVFPFSKTGGLADVLSSLPKAQAMDPANQVVVFSPLYQGILDKFKLQDTGYTTWVTTAKGTYDYRLFCYQSHNVTWYFCSNLFQFDRSGFYNHHGVDYEDNYLRFGCFCKAALNFMDALNFAPHVVHGHDWQSAFAFPHLVQENWACARVFTVHNLAFQGVFFSGAINDLKIDPRFNHMDCLEFYGKANFMKGALELSHAYTTVSPGYKDEILNDNGRLGLGLEPFIRSRQFKFYGILNGIDYEDWNPATDYALYANYSITELDKRNKNKQNVCREFALPQDKPLFAVVSRFTDQKGLPLILDSLNQLKHKDITLLLLGDGYQWIIDGLNQKAQDNPNLKVVVGYDDALSRKIYAAADFFLMPSLFEPCGLSQLIAMKYGALPVARYTGGLKNTVSDVAYGGCGIVFEPYTADELLKACQRALDVYASPYMADFRVRAMQQDFSWQRSCCDYEDLYRRLI